MHDKTDDLLQELADLEADALTPSSAPEQSDQGASPNLKREDVLLEATTQAQQAAELAQVATDRTLSLGKEQKESIIEISEALGTWRQASRAAHKELQASRKKMAAMLGITAFLGVATLAGNGWMLWQIRHAAETAKADVLDLLQTQLAVFNQKTALKLDELAAVIESLQAELNQTEQRLASPAAMDDAHQETVSPIPDLKHELAMAARQHPEAQRNGHAPEPNHKAGQAATNHDTPQAHAPSTVKIDPEQLARIEQSLEAMRQQLEGLLKRQQQVQAPKKPVAVSDPAALKEVRKLLAEQSQQLKIIRSALWKLRQQRSAQSSAQLKQLQQSVQRLSQQIAQLQTQQKKTLSQLEALRQQTAKLSQERPYIYKAPPLNLE